MTRGKKGGSSWKDPRAVIVVSSHVVRGSVGNRASVFALETLGCPVWAVPTICLPWHPGHGFATRIVPPAAEFSAMMRDLEGAAWIGEVGAVLSAYLGDAAQADAVASLVRAVKQKNPDAIYLCDPILGDRGGLYVPEEVARAQRDRLMPLADIATPNRYELAWMAGNRLDTLESVFAAAAKAGPETMLVTSAPTPIPGRIANLLISPHEALVAEHTTIEKHYSGTGDLAAALFIGWLLKGASPAQALSKATASVHEALERASERNADEMLLASDAASLADPRESVVELRAHSQRALS